MANKGRMSAKQFQVVLDLLGAMRDGETPEFRYYRLPSGTVLGFEPHETWADIAEALCKESGTKVVIQ